MNDDIQELMELVDGERALPDGFEERLLRQILTTASGVEATESPVGGDPRTEVPTRVGTPRPRGRVSHRRRTPLLVGAAAVAVVIAAVTFGGLLRGDDRRPVVTEPTTSGISVPVPLGELDDDELCATIVDGVGAAGFSDPAVPDTATSPDAAADAATVEQLADGIEEYERRRPDGDLRSLITALRAAVIELRDGSPESAQAAHRRVTDLLDVSAITRDC